MKNLRRVLAICLLFAQAAPLQAMNENTVGSAGALTRDQVMRLNALKYQMAKRDPVKVLRKLTREERMRRKPAPIAAAKPVVPEKQIVLSDKQTEPQFFFILDRPPIG